MFSVIWWLLGLHFTHPHYVDHYKNTILNSLVNPRHQGIYLIYLSSSVRSVHHLPTIRYITLHQRLSKCAHLLRCTISIDGSRDRSFRVFVISVGVGDLRETEHARCVPLTWSWAASNDISKDDTWRSSGKDIGKKVTAYFWTFDLSPQWARAQKPLNKIGNFIEKPSRFELQRGKTLKFCTGPYTF